MDGSKRAIKGGALAFAIFLVCIIISALCGTAMLAARIFGVWDNWSTDTEPGEITVIENGSWAGWTPEDTKRNLRELEIDVSTASVRIVEADKFRVETNNKRIKDSYQDGKLRLEEEDLGFWQDDWDTELVVYLPHNLELRKADLSFGAAQVDLERLAAEEVKLDLGAGKAVVRQLFATRTAEVDGGAGVLEILDGEIRNLDLDMGVGKTVLKAKLLGSSSVDAGVGKLEVGLMGNRDDYRISVQKGLGSIKIDDQEVDGDTIYGAGMTELKINGGVGAIEVRFF